MFLVNFGSFRLIAISPPTGSAIQTSTFVLKIWTMTAILSTLSSNIVASSRTKASDNKGRKCQQSSVGSSGVSGIRYKRYWIDFKN